VPNNNDTFYNSYSLEDSLLQACRFALSNDYNKNYVIDKHVTFFINDKKKYPTEFFKLYLNYFPRAESLDIDLLEINFVEKEEQYKSFWYKHGDYRFDKASLETCKFRVNCDYMKSIDVEFENTIDNYSIDSKMLLTIYQVLYKGILVNAEKIDDLVRRRSVLITADHMHEFLNFVKYGVPVSKNVNTSVARNVRNDNYDYLKRELTFTKPDYQTGDPHEHRDMGSNPHARNIFDSYHEINEGLEYGAAKRGSGDLKKQLQSNIEAIKAKVSSKPNNNPAIMDLVNSSYKVLESCLSGNLTDKGDLRTALARMTSELDKLDSAPVDGGRRQLIDEVRSKRDGEADFWGGKGGGGGASLTQSDLELERAKRDAEEQRKRERLRMDQEDKAEAQKKEVADRERREEETRERKRSDKDRRDRERRDQEDNDRRESEENERQRVQEELYQRRIQIEEEDRRRSAQEEEERKSRDAQDRRDREEKDRRDREEKDRRDREEKDRRDREEKDRRDREEKDRRDREEKDRRDREEKDRRDREEKDRRDRGAREDQDRREADEREQARLSEESRAAAELEQRKRDDADRMLNQQIEQQRQEAMAEDNRRNLEAKKAEAVRFMDQQIEKNRLAAEAQAKAEAERQRVEAERQRVEAELQAQPQQDENDFEDLDDMDDDWDEALASPEKFVSEKKTQKSGAGPKTPARSKSRSIVDQIEDIDDLDNWGADDDDDDLNPAKDGWNQNKTPKANKSNKSEDSPIGGGGFLTGVEPTPKRPTPQGRPPVGDDFDDMDDDWGELDDMDDDVVDVVEADRNSKGKQSA
jgi:hypothetical protein